MSRDIWTADCETAQFGHSDWKRLVDGEIHPKNFAFIWGAFNGDEYHEFNSTDDFLDFIARGEKIVYAHNGGKFDWHFCLHKLEPFSELMVIAGRLARFKIRDCEFRDSYNILPIPLGAWEKDDFDYSILAPELRNKPENKKKISRYLRHDCEYLHDIVTKYVAEYGTNLTQAGAAMKFWQKQSGIKAPSSPQSFYEYFGPYYYGGRVECFQSGIIEKPFKVVDINSAYPHAMKHRHAWGQNYIIDNKLPNSRAYTERAFICVEGISAGAFPYRTKTGLDFPDDGEKRRYFVTGWEFLAAIETRALSDWEIISCITFSDSIDFCDYVDHFYDLKTTAKNNGDKASYIFAKLFLNSLYGKFAANPEKYNEYTVVAPEHITAAQMDGFDFCAELSEWALMSKGLEEHKQRYYNVATAASITGFVRAMLWRAISDCDGVLYCDTDSIAAHNTDSLPLDNARLGAWDVESECDYGAIGGKKLYAFRDIGGKWKTASKGVHLSPEEIIKVAKGEEIGHTPDAPSFSLKRGINFNSRKIIKTA